MIQLEVKLYIPEISLLFAFLINLAFGFLVYRKAGAHRRVNLTFSVLSWSGAGWGFSVLMIYFTKGSPSMLFWGRMSFATSGIIPTAFLIFALLFPRERRSINSSKLILLGSPAVFFSGLSFTDQIVLSFGQGSTMFNYGRLYPYFSIYLVGYIFMGLLVLVQTYRRSIGIDRLQVKYCLLGMFFTASLGLVNNLFLPMTGKLSSF